MTLQQLKYMITAAEAGSITEAAKELFISQPSLSGAVKEVEKEAGISIFTRCRAGIALTKEGMEFLGYARQVVQQMNCLNQNTFPISRRNSGFAYQRSITPLLPTPLLSLFSALVRNALSLS